mmetsp:Transcript_53334/g.98624  ORF Transcript_53334/g.98624 Transcript_53334/m.98624 type:complete len:220 (-) Transcript_53334:61-720(-)
MPWDDDVDIVVMHEDAERLWKPAFLADADERNFYLQNGYFCEATQYIPTLGYLKRHVKGNYSRFDADELYDDCTASIGFFGRITRWHRRPELRASIDLWHAFPVTLGNTTMLSYGGGTWLFTYQDIFPRQRCWIATEMFYCPARTRLWISREYHSLGLPWVFDDLQCELVERRSDSAWKAKWADTTIAHFPEVPQIILDGDELHMYVPDAYRDEVVHVQ